MVEVFTIRDITGMGNVSSKISDSALIIIDAQNTYAEGAMKLDGIHAALLECRQLLDRFRAAGRPIVHIRHDAGPGSPYDVSSRSGQIIDSVAPIGNEPVITKKYPNSFVNTELDELLKHANTTQLIIAGFMSHMCVNSTARSAFSLGYRPTVVASATATRALPSKISGGVVAAEHVHEAALAALSDLPAVVVRSVADVPD